MNKVKGHRDVKTLLESIFFCFWPERIPTCSLRACEVWSCVALLKVWLTKAM